jgi:hypothetical protein
MAAVALTFVLGVDRATNCYTLQNHCCFELGEKLSKNDSAKKIIYIYKLRDKIAKTMMNVLVKLHNH